MIDEVKKLYSQGVGIRAISRKLHLHRATVSKYLKLEVALPKNSASRTKIFLFEDYIRNAVATRPGVLVKDLYYEIKALGYERKKTVVMQI
jgi:transposase